MAETETEADFRAGQAYLKSLPPLPALVPVEPAACTEYDGEYGEAQRAAKRQQFDWEQEQWERFMRTGNWGSR